MKTVTLARHAMATRFELVLHGENPVRLRAAGEEALDEVERLEAQLSLFQPSSEIAHLNARAAQEPVRVTAEVFALLEQARALSDQTGGAFDITVGPLLRCWGFRGGSHRQPGPDELAAARVCVGMHLVELRPEDRTVRFKREGVAIDLGAIGKGYAIQRAAELLREAGVESGLLHGGTSTVYAIGQPPETPAWRVALETPRRKLAGTALQLPAALESEKTEPFAASVLLRDEALSVSAVWGRFYESEGKVLGHVLSPITGAPAAHSVMAGVILPSATESDALSTALLVLGTEGFERIVGLRSGMRALLVSGGPEFRVQARAVEVCM